MAGADDESLDSLPPEVAALGVPERMHRVGSWVLWLCGLVGLAAMGPAGMCFYFLWRPFGANPPPPVVALIGGCVFALAGLVIIGMGVWARQFSYVVYPEALVQVHGRRCQIFRWGQIQEVFEKRMGPQARYRIGLGDGRKISIAYIVKDHQILGNTIVTRVAERVLPKALETFDAEGTVSFGPLSISRDVLTYKGKSVAWDQVTRLNLEFNPPARSTQLEVWVSGKRLAWCSVPDRTIPNLSVFLELAATARPGCLQ